MRPKKLWMRERPAKSGKDPLRCKHVFVLVDSDALPTCTECGFNQLELQSMQDEEIKYIAKEVAKEYSEKVMMDRERRALELEADRKRIIEDYEKELLEKEEASKRLKKAWAICTHNKTHLNSRGNPQCDSCGKLVKTTLHTKPLLIGSPGSRMTLPPIAPFIPAFTVGSKVKLKDTHQIGLVRAINPVTASRMGMVYAYEVELYYGGTKKPVGSRICREDEIESYSGTLEKTPRKKRIANKTRKHLSKLIISDNEITFS